VEGELKLKRRSGSETITDQQLMLEQMKFCGYGARATGAE
jgi:hypothetical protein